MFLFKVTYFNFFLFKVTYFKLVLYQKEWVQANTNPSASQQSKQVGSGKEPPQVEHTQTGETIENEGGATTVRKTQETQVRTDEGASVTLRRGVEEG
jgi:hypothetical protein